MMKLPSLTESSDSLLKKSKTVSKPDDEPVTWETIRKKKGSKQLKTLGTHAGAVDRLAARVAAAPEVPLPFPPSANDASDTIRGSCCPDGMAPQSMADALVDEILVV